MSGWLVRALHSSLSVPTDNASITAMVNVLSVFDALTENNRCGGW